jgi:hypothetical protein
MARQKVAVPAGRFVLPQTGVPLKANAYQPSEPEGRMLLSWFRRFALSIVFLFAVGSAAWAQFPLPMGRVDQDTKAEQMRELVSKYCRLDYDGARMGPQGWPKLQPLVWWKTNPDYTQMNVISRYTVETAPVLTHGKYTITVHYRLLGRFETGIGYSPEAANSNEDVDYTVTAVNDEWRIDDAEPNFPHPSRAAMLKWLNDQISTTQDPAAKNLYQEAVQKLQAQSASPFAK